MTTVPTAGDEERLVERLREAARDIRNDGTPSQVGLTDEECEQVADLITRLRQERDEAQLNAAIIEGVSNELDIALTASNAEAERLRDALRQAHDALRPFAEYAPYVDMFVEGRAKFGGSPILPTKHFRKSHFDAAARALQGSAKQ